MENLIKELLKKNTMVCFEIYLTRLIIQTLTTIKIKKTNGLELSKLTLKLLLERLRNIFKIMMGEKAQ